MATKKLFQPRPYQTECLQALARARAEGITAGLVEMASGLGKTVTVILDAEQYLAKYPNARFLYVCDQETILVQSMEKFHRYFGMSRSCGLFTGAEKTLHRVDFLFATFQSLAKYPNAFADDTFAYIINDEAHHAMAPTFKPVLQRFRAQFLLGLTATPERGDGQDIKDIYQKVIYRMSILDGWAQGWLATVDYRLMLDELNEQELRKYADLPVDERVKISMAQLNRTIFAPQRDEEIVRVIREQITDVDHPQVCIYCATIPHAEAIAKCFAGEAAVVHSEQSSELNNAILAQFRDGQIRFLISVNMLNEGYDVPEANVLVFLRATESLTIFLQQLGRGLRLKEGKRVVKVLDFVVNLTRIDMMLDLQKRVREHIRTLPPHSQPQAVTEPLILNIRATKFRMKQADIEQLMERLDGSRFWTKAMLIVRLQKRAQELGKTTLLESDIGGDYPPSISTYRYLFGCWNNALLAAGLEVSRRFAEEQLIRDLQDLYKRLGRVPMKDEVDADENCASRSTYDRFFGTFYNALVAAGIAPERAQQTKRQDVLTYLKTALAELGDDKIPSRVGDFVKLYHKYPWTVYKRHFGAWSNAVLEATNGRVRVDKCGDTKQKIAAELRELTLKLGRPPKDSDIREAKLATNHTYCDHFGPTWWDVLINTGSYKALDDYLSALPEALHLQTTDKSCLTVAQIAMMQDFVREQRRPLQIGDLKLLCQRDPSLTYDRLRFKVGGMAGLNEAIDAIHVLAKLTPSEIVA